MLPERYDERRLHRRQQGTAGAQTPAQGHRRGLVDCVVVYKVDDLSRSLLDFAGRMEVFEQKGISFVSTTQQFSTATPIGRLTLHLLLSFARFERDDATAVA